MYLRKQNNHFLGNQLFGRYSRYLPMHIDIQLVEHSLINLTIILSIYIYSS